MFQVYAEWTTRNVEAESTLWQKSLVLIRYTNVETVERSIAGTSPGARCSPGGARARHVAKLWRLWDELKAESVKGPGG